MEKELLLEAINILNKLYIYEIETTPTFTAPTDTTTKVIADIKIIDIDDNTFYIQNNTFKIKVL